jgi:hypothetical protein
MKTINTILAIPAAAPAIPPNPSTAAISAMTRSVMTRPSMVLFSVISRTQLAEKRAGSARRRRQRLRKAVALGCSITLLSYFFSVAPNQSVSDETGSRSFQNAGESIAGKTTEPTARSAENFGARGRAADITTSGTGEVQLTREGRREKSLFSKIAGPAYTSTGLVLYYLECLVRSSYGCLWLPRKY